MRFDQRQRVGDWECRFLHSLEHYLVVADVILVFDEKKAALVLDVDDVQIHRFGEAEQRERAAQTGVGADVVGQDLQGHASALRPARGGGGAAAA